MDMNRNDEDWQSRTRLLLGDDAVERLGRASVLVAGVGGVGGYVLEMLARSGVGAITAVDSDAVAPGNINRQLIASRATVGQPKVTLWAERVAAINPDCRFTPLERYIDTSGAASLLEPGFDFVADCIDTVAPKVELLARCLTLRIPVISSMGAGGRLDPTQVRYGHLADTREDGLARAVRQGFKRRGICGNPRVVWSAEAPRRRSLIQLCEANKRSSFGTLASIPAIFGLYMANAIVLRLAGVETHSN